MKYIDVTIAAVTAISSTILSFVSYVHIEESNKPKSTFLEEKLMVGTHTYDILSNQTCIGSTEVQLEHTKATFLQTKGEIHAEMNHFPIDIGFSLSGYFNPLGQLSESTLTLESNKLSLHFVTRDINPIQFQVAAKSGNKTYEYSSKLQGPLSIKEYKPGHMRLEYEGNVTVDTSQLKNPVEFLRTQYNLEISERTEDSLCTESNIDRIDVTNLLKIAANLSSSHTASNKNFLPKENP